MPAGYFALSERTSHGPISDVLALQTRPRVADGPAGPAVQSVPPRTRVVARADDAAVYARRADRISIRLNEGDLVALIELVSPGNKDSVEALRKFVRKALRLLRSGVHFLAVDLFPPTARDPQGIHKAIWDAIRDEPFELPPDKRLTLASYATGRGTVAYVEPVAVGDVLPDMPLFLTADEHIPCPLEATYQTTWSFFPAHLKDRLELPA